MLASLTESVQRAGGGQPTWTDKEVLVAFFQFLVVFLPILAGAVGFVVRWLVSSARSRARVAEEEAERLRKQLVDWSLHPHAIEELRSELQDANRMVEALESKIQFDEKQVADEREKAKELHDHIKGILDRTTDRMQVLATDLDARTKQIDKATNRDGHFWLEDAYSNAPTFVSLAADGRTMPIISLFNLKGGVGKTTLAANLGAALDNLGYRVLFVDLDFQGSLTSFLLDSDLQTKAHEEGRLISEFFAGAVNGTEKKLSEYIFPVLDSKASAIVPTVDRLAYTEMNLAVRWMLRVSNKDPRFLLRKVLHHNHITKNFDVVILDCPPIINISCVNALTASDYVLIPVMPSRQVVDRVPPLLKRLQEFQQHVNPQLKVLGIVANRTSGDKLSYQEKNRFADLNVHCRNVWGQDVTLFDTIIKQSVRFRDSEDELRPLGPDDDMFAEFKKLALELDARLPSYCRAPAREPEPAE